MDNQDRILCRGRLIKKLTPLYNDYLYIPGDPIKDMHKPLHKVVDNWFVRNSYKLSRAFAIVFGIIWGIDGYLKFLPGLAGSLGSMINSAAIGQPSWLQPWFSFWSSQVASNAQLWVYLVGVLELCLAFSLITGFLRKTAYTGGFLLSFFIWAVPEGFGGAIGPGSTDIGTGIVYAMVFLFLLMLNATHGTNPYTLDAKIEKKIKWWKALAELRS